jgi:uncharacterized phage-like protein YoqJ
MEITKSNLKAYVEFIKSQTPERLFVVGATGHRLGEKVGGYTKEVEDNLLNISTNILDEINPTSVISGMAIGWDFAIAKASLHLGIGLVAAIPFKGQESRWAKSSQNEYWDILNNPLTSSHIVCKSGYESWKMQRRNRWMADRVNLMLAFWDGNKEGGTANCIEYCKKKNIPWINLYPTKKIIKEEEEKIIIGNLKNLSPKLGYMDIICDRSSTLGNPYVLEKEEDRELLVKAFSLWLDTNFQVYKEVGVRNARLLPSLVNPGLKIAPTYKHPTVDEIVSSFINLLRMVNNGQKIRLLCHCSPKLCHTSVIKNKLLEIINSYPKN